MGATSATPGSTGEEAVPEGAAARATE
jgi:hypothetical protein